jgi:hypothetical protein
MTSTRNDIRAHVHRRDGHDPAREIIRFYPETDDAVHRCRGHNRDRTSEDQTQMSVFGWDLGAGHRDCDDVAIGTTQEKETVMSQNANNETSRDVLPIPNEAYAGPVLYDASDPAAIFPPIQEIRPRRARRMCWWS